MSLVPFDFRPVESIPDHIVGIGAPLPDHVSRSDFLANAAVFVAIGFLGAGALALDRASRPRRLLALAAVVVSAAALSAGVEFGQVFLPERVSSVVDVASQVVGCLAGVLIFALLGQPLVDTLRRGTANRERPSGLVGLLLLYALGYAAYRLFPFTFTVSPSDIAYKLRVGLIALVPFQTVPASPEGLAHLIERTISAVPLGALAVLLGVRPGSRRSIPSAVLWTALGLALLEVLKLFSVFHYADSGNVILATLGALAGAAFAGGRARGRAIAASRGSRWPWLALAGWVVVVGWSEWYPWRFDLSRQGIADGIERVSLVLFRNYQGSAPEAAFADLAGTIAIAAPLGVLAGLALWRSHPDWPRRLQLAFVFLGTAALFSVLEAGQILLPGRIPDLTDVAVPTAAACLAAWAVLRGRAMARDGVR